MNDRMSLQCPYCGEVVELEIDDGGDAHQEYVEDCPVCCCPWQVEARLGNDDTWRATLRTADD